MTAPLPFQPVIIIGAARSGTNALRDAMTALPDLRTWPCDEINPIWRHGNLFWPNDEIPPEQASPKVIRFVRRQFMRIWHETGQPEFVVEKTCANTLRVPFVAKILPEARFIHLVRHGEVVTASAAKRWKGEFELDRASYFRAKAKYAPKLDLPLYALATLRQRLAVWLGTRERLSVWGPRFAGVADLKGAPVEELCARQWVASVDRADTDLTALGDGRVHKLSYEAFVADPAQELSRIAMFLGSDASEADITNAVAGVRRSRVQPTTGNFGAQVRAILTETLKRNGYGY
ncbi:MAG: sulfotransferase [Thalassobium sp.]|nr:MAG: sulfotransferase [Thalassobium sp.]